MTYPVDLAALRLMAGHTAQTAADFCGVSLKTWRRYEQNPPRWALALFAALAGDLGAIAPAWEGWRLCGRSGELYDANGDRYAPGYLRSFWYRNQQSQADRATIRALRRKIEALKQETAPKGAANDADYSGVYLK